MHTIITTLVDRLHRGYGREAGVVSWGSPVPAFGDLLSAKVASVGLNPSYREFVDIAGDELQGTFRRFHTLTSLGISDWSELEAKHIELIAQSCCRYFKNQPYDTWFRKLDRVVAGTGSSFYDATQLACHIDLVPFATSRKWGLLSPKERNDLCDTSCDILYELLEQSAVRLLILNGRGVVDHLKRLSNTTFEAVEIPEWSLPRASGGAVKGIAYSGTIVSLSGQTLSRDIQILGFNHNIQSSFGVTKCAIESIRAWIAAESGEAVS